MKVAIISDLHFGARKNSEVFLRSQSKFISKQFAPYLKEHKIKKIFMLGDIFDNRSSTNTKVLNEVHNLFEKHLKDFEIYLLVGNHDCYFNSSIRVNSLKPLSNFKGVHLIEDMTSVEMDGKNFVLVPWIVDTMKFVREFNKTNPDVCMGHFNITGFQYNKWKSSDDGINGRIFQKCKKVFTGHFHIRNRQELHGAEIVYVGSPYQLTRNDIDEDRGFIILDTDDLSYEYVNNTTSLKYIKLKFPEKFSKNTVQGNIVDVHVDFDESYNENKIDKYVKKIEEYGPAIPPNIFVDNSNLLGGDLDLDAYDIGSMTDLMREFIDTLEITNKEEIYDSLIDLYNEVKGDVL